MKKIYILSLCFIYCSLVTSSQVLYVAGNVVSESGSTVTISRNVTSGVNCLIVSVSQQGTFPITVTDNVSSMQLTLAVSVVSPGGYTTSMYYMINPSPGNHIISVSTNNLSFSPELKIIASTYMNVNISSPIGTTGNNTGNSATPNVTISSLVNEMVVDVICFEYDKDPADWGLNQSKISSVSNSGFGASGSRKAATPSVNEVMSWTYDRVKPWSIVALSLKPMTTLPVTLISFNGKADSKSVTLTWKTSTEENNKNYIVERSVDGLNWIQVSDVPAKQNGAGPNEYMAIDANPLPDKTIYRLKMVDNDNSYSFSKSVIVYFNQASKEIKFGSVVNPFKSSIDFGINVPQSGKLTVKLISLNGTVLAHKEMNATAGYMTLDIQDVEKFNKGVYILQCIMGNTFITKMLVKQ